jgi:fructose-1,6-bisphosphatase I
MPETPEQDERLGTVLSAWADGKEERRAVASTVEALAGAAVAIGRQLAVAPIVGGLDEKLGRNASGDTQKKMDALAHQLVLQSLQAAPVAAVASEEDDHPIVLTAGAPLVVAVDPLDGSGNLAINGPIGLIFSIRPNSGGAPEEVFLRPGNEQVAAGFVLYGPATMLVVTTGAGTDIYVLQPAEQVFVRSTVGIRVPRGTPAYAVNSSNARHWSPEFRSYVADLQAGAEGLRGQDFNMRWYGALVIEALRILIGGGIYLYPADRRPKYRSGWLRLVYEAHPVALLMEQAGGAATDGRERILNKSATNLHQRTPLVFGSADKVARVGRYLDDLSYDAERAPLFAKRGLFRE